MKPPLHFDIEQARQSKLAAMERAKANSIADNIPAERFEPAYRIAITSVEMRLEFLRLLNEGFDNTFVACSYGTILGQMFGDLIANAPNRLIATAAYFEFAEGLQGRLNNSGEDSTITATQGGHA